jgi:hypothetical protein
MDSDYYHAVRGNEASEAGSGELDEDAIDFIRSDSEEYSDDEVGLYSILLMWIQKHVFIFRMTFGWYG